MNKNTLYVVKNRSSSRVVYRIPELGVRRDFAPGQELKISYDELEKLTFKPGGKELLENFLQIVNDKTVMDSFGIKTELEYNMSEADIVKLLRDGSLDELLDALDFAPIGVIDLIKDIAIQLPLNDHAKRQAIKDKTGFDVTIAIQHIEEEKKAAAEESASILSNPTVGRRVAKEEAPAPEAPKTTGRRVVKPEPVVEETPAPKVIIKKETPVEE